MTTKTVALVVQRFGESIIGGAESHAKQIVERLQQQRICCVEVFTTTSLSYMTWDNSLAAGSSLENGILVHRFRTEARRSKLFKIWNTVFKLTRFCLPKKLKLLGERYWLCLQGPLVPSLIDALEQSQNRFSLVIFFTYLYYPTVFGLPRLSVPTLIVPTAHDEFPFRFWHTKQALSAAANIFANSDAEYRTILRYYPDLKTKVSSVGVGIDTPSVVRNPIKSQPIRLLYLGRIGRSKSVDQLIQYFEYAESVLGKGVIELRLAGPIDAGFDLERNTSRHIVYLGILGEIEKQQEIMRASCIVNPSHHESLSLLVLEGIVAERPILVQTSCQVLSDYTKLYETVYGFRTPSDFLIAVKRLIRELDNSESLGLALKHAADQVKTRHSWSLVLQKYADLLPS